MYICIDILYCIILIINTTNFFWKCSYVNFCFWFLFLCSSVFISNNVPRVLKIYVYSYWGSNSLMYGRMYSFISFVHANESWDKFVFLKKCYPINEIDAPMIIEMSILLLLFIIVINLSTLSNNATYIYISILLYIFQYFK